MKADEAPTSPYTPPEATPLEPTVARDDAVAPAFSAGTILRVVAFVVIFSVAGALCRLLADVLYITNTLPAVLEYALKEQADVTLPLGMSAWQFRLVTALALIPVAMTMAWGANRLLRPRTPWFVALATAAFAEGSLTSSGGVENPSAWQGVLILASYAGCFYLVFRRGKRSTTRQRRS